MTTLDCVVFFGPILAVVAVLAIGFAIVEIGGRQHV